METVPAKGKCVGTAIVHDPREKFVVMATVHAPKVRPARVIGHAPKGRLARVTVLVPKGRPVMAIAVHRVIVP